MRALASVLLACALLSGCVAPNESDGRDNEDGGQDSGSGDGPSASTYLVHLFYVPAEPIDPGSSFNVTVRIQPGEGKPMATRTSDHIGAHFWNYTVADPTASLGDAKACAHASGDLPGQYSVRCTAPLESGVYTLHGHARLTGQDGQVRHWWSTALNFIVK